ncbi:hypothetical protein B0H12DRAFT_1245001 [Mycena haematopus]|nr:hypothetical protein B0H12DRAFT_1245001 [Mycena haematopus]
MSGLLNKGKEFLNNSGSSNAGNTNTNDTSMQGQTQGNQEDYVDKGVDAFERKEGLPDNRATNEKITDSAAICSRRTLVLQLTNRAEIEKPNGAELAHTVADLYVQIWCDRAEAENDDGARSIVEYGLRNTTAIAGKSFANSIERAM